jgi:hypothetical protein
MKVAMNFARGFIHSLKSVLHMRRFFISNWRGKILG